MYIGHAHLSVCLSATACSHYCTDSNVTWGMVGGVPSCSLLGGFAIGALVSLLWQHSTMQICNRCTWEHSGEHEVSASRCLYSLYACCSTMIFSEPYHICTCQRMPSLTCVDLKHTEALAGAEAIQCMPLRQERSKPGCWIVGWVTKETVPMR